MYTDFKRKYIDTVMETSLLDHITHCKRHGYFQDFDCLLAYSTCSRPSCALMPMPVMYQAQGMSMDVVDCADVMLCSQEDDFDSDEMDGSYCTMYFSLIHSSLVLALFSTDC